MLKMSANQDDSSSAIPSRSTSALSTSSFTSAVSIPHSALPSLADCLPVGVFAADAAGRVFYTNERLRAICGLPVDTPADAGWMAAVHPDDRERVAAEWAQAVAHGSEWQSEFRCRDGNGETRFVAGRSSPLAPLTSGGGPSAGHAGIIEDISTRTRLQSKVSTLLVASRMLLESSRLTEVLPATMTLAKDLIEADGYAVWRLAPGQWRIVASTGISDRFASGVLETYQGQPATTITFSETRVIEDVLTTPGLDERQDAYASEGIRSMLIVPLSIQGTFSGTLVFYYRVPRRFDDLRIQTATALGNLAAAAISSAELHEEELSQRARAERAHQRAAFLAEVGIVLSSSLDYEATLKAVAELVVPRVADWCAVDILEPDGQLKRVAAAHVDPAKLEFARTYRERYAEPPESPSSVQYVIKSGRPYTAASITDEMLVAAARDAEHLQALRYLQPRAYAVMPLIANGRPLGAMTFVNTESDRPYRVEDEQFLQSVAERAALAVDNARAYSQARAANRAKDEFLATLSHELRTPINAIMGWAQMLQHGVVDEKRLSHAIEAIVRNAAAQARLIEDLLDLSRIISGKLRLDVELIDVGAVVSVAVATFEPAADAKGLRLHTVADDSSARVYGDRQRLQQAVWNLLSNAVKFTPRGGRVQVQVLRINSHVEIVVSDTGEGIRIDDLPFIFDRFRQADSSSTRRHTGLGLGLAIVRHIVELHGGTVDALSDGVGMGATFRIKLPISVAKTTAAAQAEATEHPAVPMITTDSLAVTALPDLAGTRVLIVEDEPDAREMIAYLLRQRNAEVTIASSVEAALSALESTIPDVLLSDIEMPDRDGYDLIAAVRALPQDRGARIPAAALTAYSRPEDRAKSMLAGYDAHLSKPVDLSELVATIVRLKSRSS
jgi:PAS domain S-box-containing protein